MLWFGPGMSLQGSLVDSVVLDTIVYRGGALGSNGTMRYHSTRPISNNGLIPMNYLEVVQTVDGVGGLVGRVGHWWCTLEGQVFFFFISIWWQYIMITFTVGSWYMYTTHLSSFYFPSLSVSPAVTSLVLGPFKSNLILNPTPQAIFKRN